MKAQNLVVCLTVLCAACNGQPVRPIQEPEPVRQPPAACLTECSPVAQPASPVCADIVTYTGDVLDTFRECSMKHAECVEWFNGDR